MLLLMLFALIAGAGTAITPCVLPVAAGAAVGERRGGRRRPLGIVVGLAATFTIAIVALAQLVKGVGLASGAARTLAIVVLIGFGVVAARSPSSPRASRRRSRAWRASAPRPAATASGPGSAVGGALGFVCAPCAGPILAAVTSVSASSGATARVVARRDLLRGRAAARCCSLYALGGRAVIDRIRRVGARAHASSARSAPCCSSTGVADGGQPRRPLRGGARQGHEPAGVPGRPDPLAGELERASRTGWPRCARPSRFATAPARGVDQAGARPGRARVAIPGVKTPSLPVLGAAPEFTDTQQWFNTPGGKPLTLAGLRGHVVLVDFWTYTCINCIRTLPFLKGLYAHLPPRTAWRSSASRRPSSPSSRRPATSRRRSTPTASRYPVVQDNKLRHLERLPEPVLAGRVPDRRQGPGPAHPVRRGRLQAGRGGGPRSCCTTPGARRCRRR